jgi:hypothetical protein
MTPEVMKRTFETLPQDARRVIDAASPGFSPETMLALARVLVGYQRQFWSDDDRQWFIEGVHAWAAELAAQGVDGFRASSTAKYVGTI